MLLWFLPCALVLGYESRCVGHDLNYHLWSFGNSCIYVGLAQELVWYCIHLCTHECMSCLDNCEFFCVVFEVLYCSTLRGRAHTRFLHALGMDASIHHL